MTFELRQYQTDAVDAVTEELLDARAAYDRRRKLTAVGLSAPTGAGKTVIATSILEGLIFGDAESDPRPDLAVLWITDDPALNRQTRDKMLLASQRFTDGDFVEIDTDGGNGFDEKRLRRGKIHFAHVQLLGRGTTSMQPSDSREHGLWQIIATTALDYGSDFLVVIDEAHKGTGKAGRDTATIIARLCHGGSSEHFTGITQPPAPVILGITATPRRFKDAMDRARRSLEMVEVPIADVRESGLLKDRIIVRHPGEDQPSEATLLAQAVAALQESDAAWGAYTDDAGIAPIEPLLVVQVPPGIKDAELGEIVTALTADWPLLKGDAIAHAFDSHAPLDLPGDRTVRYVAPDRIAGDTRVRVVLFKNALTTGWDCPRAEVMLSLRSAKDPTVIAQLIGRMVRTPLADRIETDESLNWVTLYLPHYDTAQVALVVEALGEDTGGDVEIVVEPMSLPQRDDLPDEVWRLLASLPSSARLKKAWKSETDRLLGLARLLRGHNLVERASSQARARLVGAIKTEVAVHEDEIERLVDDIETLDMTETVWDNRRGAFVESERPGVQVTARVNDIEWQFKTAVRVLPDATAKWFWDTLMDEDDDLDDHEARARVAALVKTPEMTTLFKSAIENAAAEQITAWRTQYANQVQMLGRQARLDFEAAWNPRSGILVVDLEVADTVSAPTERITGTGDQRTTTPVPTYPSHLYAAPAGHAKVPGGEFPAVLTSWESDVLAKELGHSTLTGWYRNPARSKHGLAIPYPLSDDADAGWALMYPDFLFFHTVTDMDGTSETVVDIVDPHLHNQSDTGPKWAALARWSAENASKVRRAVAVVKVGDRLLALDLTQDGIAERLEGCAGRTDVEALFASLGGDY